MIWEKVHAVYDVYDCPRSGIAEIRGEPYTFLAEFSDSLDDYTGRYLVWRTESDVFSLAMEDWVIFLRWKTIFGDDPAKLGTYPVLPEDRDRHDRIKSLLGDWLNPNEKEVIYKHPRFRRIDKDRFEVRWLD